MNPQSKEAASSERRPPRSRRNVVLPPGEADSKTDAPTSGVVSVRATRALAFVMRHVWSITLAGLSGISFLHLASEIRENELGPFDQFVAAWLQAARGTWDWPMLALTHFGEFRQLAAVCCVSAAALAGLGKRRESLFLIACSLGAALGSVALKLLFQRVRPNLTAPYLVSLPDSFSFPSGHAMGSVGVVGGLVVLGFALPFPTRWRILMVGVAVPLILGVAASRVYFGVHYPSDVVGGQLAGAAWVALMAGWFFPRLLPAEAFERGHR